MHDSLKYIAFFNMPCPSALYGSKASSLAHAYASLSVYCKVPSGYAISINAYWDIVKENNIEPLLQALTQAGEDSEREKLGSHVRGAFEHAHLPHALEQEIRQACKFLATGRSLDVAVRSSATAEDLPNASFAGLQESYLHITSEEEVVEAYKAVIASLFTARALSYRASHNFSEDKIAMAVIIQNMVRADRGCSGTLFTIDPETGFEDVAIIASSYGLGEPIVQGAIEPDEYAVIKSRLKEGYKPLVKKKLGSKTHKMADMGKSSDQDMGHLQKVSEKDQKSFSLPDEYVLELARIGCALEEKYAYIYGKKVPLDIEWALDGIDNTLYIVQVRPLACINKHTESQTITYSIKKTPSILKGVRAGNGIVHGICFFAKRVEDTLNMPAGSILVVDYTAPDWVSVIKRAKGLITQKGGRTCHAALVARELAIPALVGASGCLEILKPGMEITLDCSSGTEGHVYEGFVPFTTETHTEKISKPLHLSTKVYAILADPDKAWEVAQLPFDGVGLVRLEFLMAQTLGLHPQALVNEVDLPEEVRKELYKKIEPYSCPKTFFIHELARGIACIVTAFGQKKVIVRTSDFKTNEYRELFAGHLYEVQEENPMIGLRGAARYLHPRFYESFILECQALVMARDVYGARNMDIMIPFVRTPDEIKLVKKILEKEGVLNPENATQLFMMVEVPSNILLLEEYARWVDGFSIGSNDLTQLILGVDRDSSELSGKYSELDPAIKWCLEHALLKARMLNKPLGICGQGPADFPELAEFLLKKGITSIALAPHALTSFFKHIENITGEHPYIQASLKEAKT